MIFKVGGVEETLPEEKSDLTASVDGARYSCLQIEKQSLKKKKKIVKTHETIQSVRVFLLSPSAARSRRRRQAAVWRRKKASQNVLLEGWMQMLL